MENTKRIQRIIRDVRFRQEYGRAGSICAIDVDPCVKHRTLICPTVGFIRLDMYLCGPACTEMVGASTCTELVGARLKILSVLWYERVLLG